MKQKKFNLIASMLAFALGTIYIFSDGASISANVIGASGTNASVTAVYGVLLLLGSMGLFLVSMNSTDHRSIDLERLVRRTKEHRDLNSEPLPRETEEKYVDIIEHRKNK